MTKRVQYTIAIAAGFILLCVALSFNSNKKTTLEKAFDRPNQKVNPIVGNAGFVNAFGRHPEIEDEKELVKSHLSYALAMLRNADVSALSASQLSNRKNRLNELEAYIRAGVFPENFDYPGERKPCFIDRNDRLCAVGHLVTESTGLDAAREINAHFQYALIKEMDPDMLKKWAEPNGFSLAELALIQPTYVNPTFGYVGSAYIGSSAILTGLAVGSSAISLSRMNKGDMKLVSLFGVLTGVSQSVLGGIYTFQDLGSSGEKALGFANLSIGMGSVIINGIGLLDKGEAKFGATSSSLPVEPALLTIPDGLQAPGLRYQLNF